MNKIKSKKLLRLVRSHPLIYSIASNTYSRYESLKFKREFHSRINQLDPDEYLDTSSKPNWNVIILVVDSLRDSHLSCQGYFRETTPFLDSFKSRFTAISASPWTYPSVASILTGLYPHNHKAVLSGRIKDFSEWETYQRIRADVLTLPEMLYFWGYKVYFGTAISPAYWAVSTRAVPKIWDASTSGDHLLNDLTKWISREKKRFFAYIHLADLHIPIDPPNNFRDFFGDGKGLPQGDIRKWELLYDNALRFLDSAIERWFHLLEDMGLLDRTILVITSDHGEEFAEHADVEARIFYDQRGFYGIGHGHNVFRTIIEVPLFISGPVPDQKHSHLVSTVDIVPTIAALLGVNHNMQFDGRNVFLEDDGERPLLSEGCGYGYEKKALIIGRYKLIYSKDDGVEWLFDLEKDPHEQHPIADREVTSIFVERLNRMFREDEERRIRKIIGRRSSRKASNIMKGTSY